MNKETILAELNRLLDLGEPLLTVFPRQYSHSNDWALDLPGNTLPKQGPKSLKFNGLQLPDNISKEMRMYVYVVAIRADMGSEQFRNFMLKHSALSTWILKTHESGLAGWREAGFLQ